MPCLESCCISSSLILVIFCQKRKNFGMGTDMAGSFIGDRNNGWWKGTDCSTYIYLNPKYLFAFIYIRTKKLAFICNFLVFFGLQVQSTCFRRHDAQMEYPINRQKMTIGLNSDFVCIRGGQLFLKIIFSKHPSQCHLS